MPAPRDRCVPNFHKKGIAGHSLTAQSAVIYLSYTLPAPYATSLTVPTHN
jgi:hypothetical protein